MRPTRKVFLFSLVAVFICHPLLFAAQSDWNPDLKAFPKEKRDSIRTRGSDHNSDLYREILRRSRLVGGRDAQVYRVARDPFGLPGQNAIKAFIDDFAVNDDTIAVQPQRYPAMVCDHSGNFIITWTDWHPCYPDIYAKRYSSSGAPLGSMFRVSDGPQNVWRQLSAIAMDGSGNFIVTWQDERDGHYDIYAQRFDSSGAPLGSNFKVNDDTGSVDEIHPAVATGGSGSLVIAWTDLRNGDWNIYAQRFDSYGIPIDSNFRVNDDAGSVEQGQPAVAMDVSGSFVIVWSDDRSDDLGDVYAQRYDSSGVPIGSNFRVDDELGTSSQYVPAITSDFHKNILVTWTDRRNGPWGDIYAQRYDSSGVPLGSNFRVDDDVGSGDQCNPAIASDGSGNFILAWSDQRAGRAGNVYAQRYDSSGAPLDSNFKVNDVSGRPSTYTVDIAVDGPGNFVIIWDDYRNDDWDLYAQRFDSAGTPLGSNFRINNPDDDVGCSLQDYPDIAVDGQGNFVITWKDYRISDYGHIFAQRFNSSGVPLGSNFTVNDPPGEGGWNFPAVASHSSGSFVVTWEGWSVGSMYPDVFAKRYDSAGTPLDSNFEVGLETGDADQCYPAVAIAGSGKSVIAWVDYRLINFDIYAQRFSAYGSRVGVNFRVNGDSESALQFSPAIAMDNDDNFIVTWIDSRNLPDDIYAKICGFYGSVLKEDFRVNDVPGSAFFTMGIDPCATPAIAVDDSGNFVIAWVDKRDTLFGLDIYAQRYNSDGDPLGPNFRVADDSIFSLQISPGVASDGCCSFIITWADDRNGSWDFYAQRFDSSGTPLGSNQLVPNPQYAPFAQRRPAVAGNGSHICFTWTDDRRGGGWDIYGKVADWIWPSMYGDVNDDGVIDIADIVYLTNYLFAGTSPPDPLYLGDANCDGEIDVADLMYVVNYLFLGTSAPGC